MTDPRLAGCLIVVAAGFSNGSFPAPSKRITTWPWECTWMVYSVLAMIVFPLLLALLSTASLFTNLRSNAHTALEVAGFGFLWGLGSVFFGLSLARLGMAISNALVSGILILLGSLGPVLLGDVRLSRHQIDILTLGESLLIGSIALCAFAAISRDSAKSRDLSPGRNGRPIMGVLIALVAGVLSSMLNFGFARGAPLAHRAAESGASFIFAPLAVWVPVLVAGAIPNLAYPAYRIHRNQTIAFAAGGSSMNWLRAALMAVLWFGAIWLYGFGSSLMGRAGTVYGWAMITGGSILTSNIWGVITGEWRKAPKSAKAMFWSSTLLILGALIVLARRS